MALICPACGTENRSVAKFCIDCVAALPTGFAATQITPPPIPLHDEGPPSLPSALAAFASAASSPPLPLGWGESPILPLPPSAPEPSPWPGVMVAVALGLLLLAAGWWLGRWLDDAPAPVPPQAVGRVETAPPVAVPAQPSAPEPVPQAAEATAALPASPAQQAAAQAGLGPGETLVQEEATPPAVAVTAPAEVARPPSTSPAPTPVARRVAATPALFAPCDGLGFVRASRCKVDLCTQPAHGRKPECAPVLAQQRRLDEKRNPQLAD